MVPANDWQRPIFIGLMYGVLILIILCQYVTSSPDANLRIQVHDITVNPSSLNKHHFVEDQVVLVHNNNDNIPLFQHDCPSTCSGSVAALFSHNPSEPNQEASSIDSFPLESQLSSSVPISDPNDPTGIIELMKKGDTKEAMSRVNRVFLSHESLLGAFPSVDHIDIAAATWLSVVNNGGYYEEFVELYMRFITQLQFSDEDDVPLTALWILFRSAPNHPLHSKFGDDVWDSALTRFTLQSDKTKTLLSSLSHDDISALIDDIHHYIANRCHSHLSAFIFDGEKTHLHEAFGLMKMIYHVNMMAEDPVPFRNFYSECVTQFLAGPEHNLKNDHRRIVYSFLVDYPFAIDLPVKKTFLRLYQGVEHTNWFKSIQVHRESIVNDALAESYSSHRSFLNPHFYVTFKGEAGFGPGVFREFFTLFSTELWKDKAFVLNEHTGNMWFNSDKDIPLERFYNIGFLIGVGFYHQCPMNLHFPQFLYHLLLGKSIVLRDLASVDPQLYNTMQQHVLDPSLTEEDIEEIAPAFDHMELPSTIKQRKRSGPDHHDISSSKRTKLNCELEVPRRRLNLKNRFEYVEMYLRDAVIDRVSDQLEQFIIGFQKVCGTEYMPLLSSHEFELLLCGIQTVDIADLNRHTMYSGGYSESDPIIQNFWEVLSAFDENDKRLFLKFVTGSFRLPAGGAATIHPPLTVDKLPSRPARPVPNRPSSVPTPPLSGSTQPVALNHLPYVSSCSNELILPPYPDKETLRHKLVQAIAESEEFTQM